MRVVFDESTLTQSDNPSGSVTGVIYFQFNGSCFPAERWNDFVVVITGWWLEALDELEREQESVLRFMDGPYWITLAKLDPGTVLASCIEDRRDAGILHEEAIDLPGFVRQLRDLGRQVVSACDRRGIASRDVDTLKGQLSQLPD